MISVVDMYGSIASIANGMDMKIFVELSEEFGKLAIIHQDNIKCASPESINMHLTQLTKDLSYLLRTIEVEACD